MGSETATRCFEENRVLFGDPNAQPEKYNLYNGLTNLAEASREISVRLQEALGEVKQLRQEVRQISREIAQMKQ
jgi:hypothetical protein